MSASRALELKEVSKYYRQARGAAVAALRQVSLEIPEGWKVAITGRSGSGKSTLLHLAAGIDEPSEGDVTVLGARLSGLSERERTLKRRDEIGLVFQFFHLLPHLKVRENVLLPAWIAGDRGKDHTERAEDLLARVGLSDRAQDPVHGLSGGEMQRVAICRALLRRPRLLLADEPTGNLDDENARVVMELLFQLVEEERSTLVFATHSTEMSALAEESFILHSGRLSRA